MEWAMMIRGNGDIEKVRAAGSSFVRDLQDSAITVEDVELRSGDIKMGVTWDRNYVPGAPPPAPEPPHPAPMDAALEVG